MANLIITLWLLSLLCNLWVVFVEVQPITLRIRLLLVGSFLILRFINDPEYLAVYLALYALAYHGSLAVIILYNAVVGNNAMEANSREMSIVNNITYSETPKLYQLVWGCSALVLWPLSLLYILAEAIKWISAT